MYVLLDEGNGCPVASTVRPRDRLLVRLHASRLDDDLAGGASPDATVTLALRAQMLVRGPARRDTARAAQRVLATAMHAPGAGPLPVPVCQDRVKDCSEEFAELIRGENPPPRHKCVPRRRRPELRQIALLLSLPLFRILLPAQQSGNQYVAPTGCGSPFSQ